MGSLFGEICHIFCCPPRPSHIVAKFAFLPPSPTYTIVQSYSGDESQIVFKPEAGHIGDYAKSQMKVFYTMSKRNSRIACLYIRYDVIGVRHFLSSANSTHDQADRMTVLFSHGNAVDIGQMAGFLYSLSQRFAVDILVYDYSGYGASTGQTLEVNLYADAEAALAELRDRYLIPLDRIVLYGQSIGTAPTVELATRHKVAGVILHSALMSGLRVVCPGTTRRFCFDPFNSIDKVEHIQSPTLVIHGTDDRVISFNHGKELFARLPNPLEPLWVEGADHNDIELFQEYTYRLERFFQVDMRQPQSPIATPPRTPTDLSAAPGEGDRHRGSHRQQRNHHHYNYQRTSTSASATEGQANQHTAVADHEDNISWGSGSSNGSIHDGEASAMNPDKSNPRASSSNSNGSRSGQTHHLSLKTKSRKKAPISEIGGSGGRVGGGGGGSTISLPVEMSSGGDDDQQPRNSKRPSWRLRSVVGGEKKPSTSTSVIPENEEEQEEAI